MGLTIQDVWETARQRGGICLSDAYLGTAAKYRWRCGAGHEWEANANSIRNGSWCPVCAGNRRLAHADLMETAKARGGVCLDPRPRGAMAKYRWRCREGHEWLARASSIRNGSWCPTCARIRQLVRGRMRTLGIPSVDPR